MVMRMLRGSRHTSGPGPAARLVALLIVLGLVGLSAPPLVAATRWVVSLL